MTLTITNRELRFEVAHNVRHLGGYSTTTGRTTSHTVIRSASLHRLTPAGLSSMADSGILTIVDLRSTVERARDVTPDGSPYGIRQIHAPVFEQDGSPVGLEAEFKGYAPVYERILESGRNAYQTLFETIADTDSGVLFHCAAGKDRTGVAAALMLGLVQVEHPTIIEDYALSAKLLEPLMAEWLPKMAEQGVDAEKGRALMASNPEDMHATLQHIEAKFGGAEGYLREIGLSEATISALHARLAA